MDPLAADYPDLSTYVFVANNSINIIDPDGRKIVFVNGYLGFGSSEGGKAYWNTSFVKGAQTYFNDKTNPYFTDIDFGMLSSASKRYNVGYEYAKQNYSTLIEGMEEGEVFRLVSHSMGGAFGTGVKKYLEEKGQTVETAVYLNTYQSDHIEIGEDDQTNIIDYQNTNDPVLFWFDDNLGKGEIENADAKIREESEESALFNRHREPIDFGKKFWETLDKKITETEEDDG